MLALTDQAREVIKGIIEEGALGPAAGLRITAANESNGDTALEFELAESPVDGDEVLQQEGAAVFLDPVAAEVLADKTLDVEGHGDHFHFSLGEQEDV